MFAYVLKAAEWEAFITRVVSAERGGGDRRKKRPKDTFLVHGHYQAEGVNNMRHLASLTVTHGFLNLKLLTVCVVNISLQDYIGL